jgi:nicotinate-nucleotide adenylyltransferase
VGVFGGTYDPVHFGHLICAEQLSESLDLDLVLFIPCCRSPHKPDYVPAEDRHRLAMTKLATHNRPGFQVSDLEIVRGGLSYTVDTVRQLREQFGPDVEIWLLMGMDAYLDFPRWERPEEIAGECRFGVACRPGYVKNLDEGLPLAKTRFVDITPVDISSTDIRERLRRGRSICFLLPADVEAYIRKNRPYPTSDRERPA